MSAVAVTGCVSPSAVDKQRAQAELEDRIAQVCGVLNATTGKLVELVAEVLDSEAWQGLGIHSPAQYVAWKCGMSPERARRLVAMASRRGDLPITLGSLSAGELSEDQAAAVVVRAPAACDAEAAALARAATVAQLSQVLRGYRFGAKVKPEPLPDDPDDPAPDDPARGGHPDRGASRFRHLSMGYTEAGTFRLAAELGADEGAVLERALAERRDALFRLRHPAAADGAFPQDVSWADALVSMAERCLDTAAAGRSHRDRTVVNVHMGLAEAGVWGHLHLGPDLSDADRRYISCDAKLRALFEAAGVAVSVGRSRYTVPTRTRLVIEDRDRGCRVPGCDHVRWLHIHHLDHWEDGGTTDTWNLVALCPYHHRLHHRGRLGIEGNPDDPHGLVFTDARGRRLTGSGSPAPPTEAFDVAARKLGIPDGNWQHPSGERFDTRWLHFNEAWLN